MSDWWKPLSFTEGRAAHGQPIIVPGWRWGGQPVALQAGKTYRFSTCNIDGTGKVLEIDHTLSLPVNLQYNAPNGDRRITRFSPAEFLYLKEVE